MGRMAHLRASEEESNWSVAQPTTIDGEAGEVPASISRSRAAPWKGARRVKRGDSSSFLHSLPQYSAHAHCTAHVHSESSVSILRSDMHVTQVSETGKESEMGK